MLKDARTASVAFAYAYNFTIYAGLFDVDITTGAPVASSAPTPVAVATGDSPEVMDKVRSLLLLADTDGDLSYWQLSLVADSSGQLQLLMVNGYGYCFNNEPQNKR